MGLFPAGSVNKDVRVISSCSAPVWASGLSGNSGRRICSLAAFRLQTLPKVSPEERKLRLRKQNAGPRQVRCIWKERFQWAQTLASPHTQKSTEFLDSAYLLFFTNSALMLRLPAVCHRVLCSLAPAFTPWQQFSQGCLRWCLLGLKSFKSPLNRLWLFFKLTGIL